MMSGANGIVRWRSGDGGVASHWAMPFVEISEPQKMNYKRPERKSFE
jgi:hypothetical protein